ncbi:MAG: ATP-binding protein [Verrucomicrobiales bacterium]|nr:ATP-binding protein [Verrucomicrobiales bacterium]
MEIFFIAFFAILAFWFGVKYLRLRSSVSSFGEDFRVDENFTTGREATGLNSDYRNFPEPLRSLANSISDTVSETVLSAESEKRHRSFLEALLNEINDAIFILDSDGEIRFLNAAARQLFPTASGYIEKPFLDICRDHRIFDTLKLAEEIGAKVSDRINMRVHDSESKKIREINLFVEAEPLTFSGNNLDTGSWVLLRDITAAMETEQIRRDFLANASHELRTPLSIITGYLESMDGKEVDLNQPLFRRAIGTMKKHGERIARIVEDMLTISKLENAKDLLKRSPFDLLESLHEMISQLTPLIEGSHVRLKVESSERDQWIIEGDRFYWDQIFFNLIENALKQNPDPGLNITVSFREVGGRIEIRIEDDGIGIPSKDLPLVFKRFYRVQKHHSQNEIKGTGLGLSIVKRAIEAHHGEITVESRPGISTVFIITIPDNSVAIDSKTSSERSNH